jgi:hypothetical protein
MSSAKSNGSLDKASEIPSSYLIFLVHESPTSSVYEVKPTFCRYTQKCHIFPQYGSSLKTNSLFEVSFGANRQINSTYVYIFGKSDFVREPDFLQQNRVTQFQNPVMKISVTQLHKIYNSILI